MPKEVASIPIEGEWKNPSNVTIATLGSHSALNILYGAKAQGFRTLIIPKGDTTAHFYRQYSHFIDEALQVADFKEFSGLEEELTRRNTILIPTGSTVAYLGNEYSRTMKTPNFGNRKVLLWEADRKLQAQWLQKAEIMMPGQYDSPKEVLKYPVIAKSFGAAGGRGYFVAGNEDQLQAGLHEKAWEQYVIQDYIVGVTFYPHYFYSSIKDRVEILGADIRYESNVDGLGRIPVDQQLAFHPEASFNVVGNIAVVARESLLPIYQAMGERFVEASRTLMGGKGIYGPFCIETIITPESDIYAMEASCRIVAGTNIFAPVGSPHSAYLFGKPMSTGERIALEIKEAMDANRLDDVLD